MTLPDGTVVPSGLDFRNTFHLNPLNGAKIFVPCGGRPGNHMSSFIVMLIHTFRGSQSDERETVVR